MELEDKTFSKIWWEKFLIDTENLSKTCVFKSCLTKEVTFLFRKYVLQILKKLAELRTNEYGYRIYVDGNLLKDGDMEKIYDSPPSNNDTIETWSERTFNNSPFGIILNLGEKFNPSLSKEIALFVEPYLEIIGFPRDGINFSIFIGNYDKTPLGIHQDPPGQDVMHFHLGPSIKTMYTWSKDQYIDLTTNKNYDKQDLDKLLPLSKEFSFEEGDIYFMPEGEYHIGKQDGLSIAITFWRYNHNEEILLRKLQQTIYNQYLIKSKILLTSDKNKLNSTKGIDRILENIKLPEDLESLSYKDLLREAYSDLRHSIHSNAGYRSNPFPIEENVPFASENRVQIIRPFKVLYKESLNKEKLYVFVRGTKLELKNFDCIKLFIDEINKGEPLKISYLLNQLDKEWDEEIGLYIINLIYQNHGLVLIQ